MTFNKNAKQHVRDLQELRGCSYTAALRELRSLPKEIDWKDYVMGVSLEKDRDVRRRMRRLADPPLVIKS